MFFTMQLIFWSLTLCCAHLWGLGLAKKVCYIGQEPDESQGGRLRWVMSGTNRKLCACTSIRPGPLNTVPLKRTHQSFYTDTPIFTDELEEIHNCFACNGMPRLTEGWFQTHASVFDECKRTDQHLCLQWELQHAYQQGYPVIKSLSLWYSNPDNQTKLNETGVTYHGPPLSLPARGLCCSRPLSYRHPLYTQRDYAEADRDGMTSDCSAQAAHLCTLVELKEAHDQGYRSMCWCYFATQNRDAQVLDRCAEFHTGPECYKRVIPNTPRPRSAAKAYCCPDRF